MDVSVIIITYNTLNLTIDCINSVFEKTSGLKFEVILVDNASCDGSKEYFSIKEEIIYVYNEKNLGFGAANNIGAKVASGKYLFLLNSDTVLLENSIKIFYDYMENTPNVSACGGNLVDANYENVPICGHFPTLINDFFLIGFYNFFRSWYKQKISVSQDLSCLRTFDVDYISGADIFIKHEVFSQLKGFDQDFFMYYEETDLFKRMSKAGLKSVIIPHTAIVHLVGGSSSNQLSLNKYRMIHNSKLLYYKKHHASVLVLFVKLFDFLGIAVRPHYYKNVYLKFLKESLKG